MHRQGVEPAGGQCSGKEWSQWIAMYRQGVKPAGRVMHRQGVKPAGQQYSSKK